MRHKLTNLLVPLIFAGGFISLIPMEQVERPKVIEYETRFEAVIPSKLDLRRNKKIREYS